MSNACWNILESSQWVPPTLMHCTIVADALLHTIFIASGDNAAMSRAAAAKQPAIPALSVTA